MTKINSSLPGNVLDQMIKEFRAAYPDRSYEEVKNKFLDLDRLVKARKP